MPDIPPTDTLSSLMAAFRQGDKSAANRLVEMLYPELRRLAASKMNGERAGHTWQPTLLVNELYLAMVKIKGLEASNRPGGYDEERERAAFLGLAGQMMRRLLIDHARPLSRRARKISFDEESWPIASGTENLQVVETALARLASIDPKFRTVVEMRVFEGLSGDEIAVHLGCSPRTVSTYWTFAKRWLGQELASRAGDD
jgi:RNA polymerase sigma factor (TIGR02999 family)